MGWALPLTEYTAYQGKFAGDKGKADKMIIQKLAPVPQPPHPSLTYHACYANIKDMRCTKEVTKYRHCDYPEGKEVSIMSLGNKVKQLRQEKGWSQDELAFHAGIDGRQISRYENDKVTPSVDVVIKLARAFNVSVDHLLIDDVPRRPLREPISKLAEKVLHLDNMSEEDEASLLHMLNAIEAKNKLKTLMRDFQ